MDEKEFDMKKELIKLEEETRLNVERVRHKNHMKELVEKTKLESFHHENELERGRIKTAEIRKNIERKNFGFHGGQS